jgi:protein involved in polysaccharide export with SLBB domain
VTKATPRGSSGSGQRGKADNLSALAVSVGLTIFIAAAQGCSTTQQAEPGAGELQTAAALTPAATTASSDQQVPVAHSGRLAELWAARSKDSFSPEFAVGPGDLLEISVPDMEQLRDREARVSASGTITLPVVGVVDVGGMTQQEEVRVVLEQRLVRYMRDPDVDVSVKEYHSREVAVVGMVQKPGLYTLETRSDTILDMISKAGGMTENASSRIIFVPAPKNGNLALQRRLVASAASGTAQDSPAGSARRIAAGAVRPIAVDGAQPPSEKVQANHPSASGLDGVGRLPAALQQANPIQIDLSSGKYSKDFVDLPARPGDVIIVPASGEVMVQGWVASPGAFKISPGMTALGAVTAAGGEQFSSSATVLRTGEDGDKVQIPINLSRVKAGEERDVAVQSGDVVIVNRSAAGAVPYLVYSLFNKFGTGAFIPLPAL